MLVCVCVSVCVCAVHVKENINVCGVYAYVNAPERGQRRMLGVLLNTFSFYPFETGFLIEPESRLANNKP